MQAEDQGAEGRRPELLDLRGDVRNLEDHHAVRAHRADAWSEGVNARIIPPGMSFPQALRLGYTGEIRLPAYIRWIKKLACATCQAPGPSDPSHPNFFKSQLRKAPDPLAIPECRADHEAYERNGFPDEQARLARAALYMLQAIHEGRLVWKAIP